MLTTSQEGPAIEITHFEKMGQIGLYPGNPWSLIEGRPFRRREWISLLVHACDHTISYSLFFFSGFCYSALPTPFLFLVLARAVLWWWLCWDTVTFSLWLLLSSPPMHSWGTLYTAYHDWFFTISPFNHFCLGMGVLLNHPLVCQLPPPLIRAGRATSHYQTKNFILFACSPWRSHPDRVGHSLSLSLMACT